MDDGDLDIDEIEETEFELGELPIERLLKYLSLGKADALSWAQTDRQAAQAAFRQKANDAWARIQQQAMAGQPYAQLIASVDGLEWTRELDIARGDFFWDLRQLNEARKQTLIHTLKEGTFETLTQLIAKDESDEHGAVNATLDELDGEFQRLRALPSSEVEYNHQLKLLNSYAVLEARLALLKLEITCIDYAPKPPKPSKRSKSPKRGLFRRATSKLSRRDDDNSATSLAKANAWEGNGTDRISTRKAAIYRLNSL